MTEEKLKILWIIPGSDKDKVNMIFAKRTIGPLEEAGIEIHLFHLLSRTNPISILKSLKIIREEIRIIKPHVVHAHYGSITSLFCVFCTKLPRVTHFRGSDINRDPTQGTLKNLITYFSSQLSCLLSNHSVFVAQNLLDKLIIKPKNYTILPSPINTSLFHPKDKDNCKKKLGLDPKKKYVAFISSGGRSIKRPELAHAAVSLAKKSNPEIEILVIHGIEPNKIPDYLSSCELLLMTSLYEGSPNCVREAMACNIPVVSVDVGDVAYWVHKDPYSTLSDASPEALSHSILSTLSKKNNKKEHIDLSISTLDYYVHKTVQIYKTLGSDRC